METLKRLLTLAGIICMSFLAFSGATTLVRAFPNPYYVDGGLIFWGSLKLLGAFILYWVWLRDYPWYFHD